MEPAQTILKKLGGPTAVAKVVGVHRTRVSAWQREKRRGGTGGTIPQAHIPTLLALARRKKIDLSISEFFVTRRPRRETAS